MLSLGRETEAHFIDSTPSAPGFGAMVDSLVLERLERLASLPGVDANLGGPAAVREARLRGDLLGIVGRSQDARRAYEEALARARPTPHDEPLLAREALIAHSRLAQLALRVTTETTIANVRHSDSGPRGRYVAAALAAAPAVFHEFLQAEINCVHSPRALSEARRHLLLARELAAPFDGGPSATARRRLDRAFVDSQLAEAALNAGDASECRLALDRSSDTCAAVAGMHADDRLVLFEARLLQNKNHALRAYLESSVRRWQAATAALDAARRVAGRLTTIDRQETAYDAAEETAGRSRTLDNLMRALEVSGERDFGRESENMRSIHRYDRARHLARLDWARRRARQLLDQPNAWGPSMPDKLWDQRLRTQARRAPSDPPLPGPDHFETPSTRRGEHPWGPEVPRWRRRSSWALLQRGMPLERVVALLGEPNEKTPMYDGEKWGYQNMAGAFVSLDKAGRVRTWAPPLVLADE